MSPTAQEAFKFCEKIAKSHYENFPVGWFIPKVSRKFVYAVYAFARMADDFSDEPRFESDRTARLDDFGKRLDLAMTGQVAAGDFLFTALMETLEKTDIPAKLLKDLLTAFRMDTAKKRYKNYQELQSYCVYSANPIGRIVLALFGYKDPKLLSLSDQICTGIQLVNHWQDIAVDLAKDRVYLPEEDMNRFGYSYDDLYSRKINGNFQALLRFEISRTRSLFFEGKPLLNALHRKLRWQVGLMWLGPMKVLEKIEENGYDIFHKRPSLTKANLIRLFLPILFGKFS